MQNLIVFAALTLSACAVAEKAAVAQTDPGDGSDDAKNDGGGKKGKETGNAGAGATTTAGDGSATAYVVNLADESICYVYIGDGAGGWTADLLGNDVLPINYYLTVTGVSPGTVELYAQGCDSADWYGVVPEVADGDDVTFVLYGGGGGDSGYADSEERFSLRDSWLWISAVEAIEIAVAYW